MAAVAGDKADCGAMIRAVGSLDVCWMHANYARLARSGPDPAALSRQLSAVDRRRRLRMQQEDLQSGAVAYGALPPCRLRPRPPS